MQWLDLDPAQARELANALAVNARPENMFYRYDYYRDNCSTRVRDALDRALGGGLKAQLSGRSQGNTWRSESVRLAWPAKWMAFGFHLGLAGSADRPLSRWEESFIPMRLRDALREVKRADGKPLVAAEQVLLPHRISQPPAETPRWRVPALFIGLAAGLLLAWIGRRHPRALAAFALPFWTVCSLLGLVMAYLWIGSEHMAAHGNENLLLLSPLCLFLLPGGWSTLRGRATSSRFRRLLWLVAASAAIAGFLKFLPFRPQQNVEWVLLLLPIHLALARSFDPKA
jgi:ribosome modulation factor